MIFDNKAKIALRYTLRYIFGSDVRFDRSRYVGNAEYIYDFNMSESKMILVTKPGSILRQQNITYVNRIYLGTMHIGPPICIVLSV